MSTERPGAGQHGGGTHVLERNTAPSRSAAPAERTPTAAAGGLPAGRRALPPPRALRCQGWEGGGGASPPFAQLLLSHRLSLTPPPFSPRPPLPAHRSPCPVDPCEAPCYAAP